MADQIFVINTLEDIADFADAVVSFRKAIECAITYAQETQTNETIEIKFDGALFTGNKAIVELESTVDIPAGAFGDHPVTLSAPEGKSVVISAPQSVEPLAVASGNDVTYANVTVETLPVETPKFAAMAMPAATAPVNVDHIYVNPDYTDAELDDAHYRTIADAVGAHSEKVVDITVEKADATTTIGALTMQEARSKVFGGAQVTGGTVTANSALIVEVPAGATAAYGSLFGGCMVKSDDDTVAARITGDSSLTIGGEGTISVVAAFGGIYLAGGTAGGTAVVTGASSLSISDGIFSNVVCGGHIVGGTSTLLVSASGSSCSLTISGGTFLKEVAAGSYNQAGEMAGYNVTDRLTISGGTFYRTVYGGNIAKTQVLATAVNNASPIDMTLGSRAFVTIDSSENTVALLKNVVLGSRYQGKIAGNCEMTFSGVAENLVLGGNTLIIGDSESASDDDHRINGARSLVFDGYRGADGAGDFAPLDLLAFDRITFADNSYVAFKGDGKGGTGFDLSAVRYWNFEYGSTLVWEKGTNSFYADALTISLNGQSVTSPWTILEGSDATLYRWDKMGLNASYPVTIDGVTATWDKKNKWYAASGYKIYREGNSLKLATLA